MRGAAGEEPETPKFGDPAFVGATTRVIAGRHAAMRGAAAEAKARGYDVVMVEEPVVGEAREAASRYVSLIAERAGQPGKVAVVSSGETTVRVTGAGRGGRNQELALAAATALAAMPGRAVLASLGTDGVDGPTDAAGAVADCTTLARAAAAGLAGPAAFLDDNNAYAFFAALGALIQTGPTGTNVGDVQIALLG